MEEKEGIYMFKKVISVILSMLILLCFVSCGKDTGEVEKSTAESVSLSKTDPEYHSVEKIKERGVLIVGGAGNSVADYIVPNDPDKYGELAGKRDGYVHEVCKKIAKELGVKMKTVEYKSVDELLKAASSGDVDIAAGCFAINDERTKLYEMTDSFQVTKESGYEVFLSVNPKSGDMIKKEKELAKGKIGVVKSTIQAKHTAAQYPDAKLYEYENNNKVLKALSDGKVDAAVFTSFDERFANKIVDAIIDGKVAQCDYSVEKRDYRGYGLILMKGNEDLCQYINSLFASLLDSGWLVKCYKSEEKQAVERGIITEDSMYFKD